MKYKTTDKMYLIDRFGKQYNISKIEDIDFVHQYFDILKKSNSSISVFDENSMPLFIKLGNISKLFVYKDNVIFIRFRL